MLGKPSKSRTKTKVVGPAMFFGLRHLPAPWNHQCVWVDTDDKPRLVTAWLPMDFPRPFRSWLPIYLESTSFSFLNREKNYHGRFGFRMFRGCFRYKTVKRVYLGDGWAAGVSQPPWVSDEIQFPKLLRWWHLKRPRLGGLLGRGFCHTWKKRIGFLEDGCHLFSFGIYDILKIYFSTC